jgi:surfeit locus 1 family protein
MDSKGSAFGGGRGGKAPRLLVPGLSTLAMLIVLLGLGSWQVERLAWKRDLLAQIAQAEAQPAVPLPAEPPPFAKVRVEGRLRDDLAALYGAEGRELRNGPQMGGQLIVPLQRPGADPVLVDRGWVPAVRRQPITTPAGSTAVEGYVRPAERAGLFSATDDPAMRRFYTLDPQAIGAALGLGRVAPFVLVAIGPMPAEGYPDPARHLPRPPNNHLQYAITWYGLAVALLVIFSLYARKVLRP